MEATANLDTTDAIEVVDTLSLAQNDLDAAKSVISEVKCELDDLEDGHATAEELVDALR